MDPEIRRALDEFRDHVRANDLEMQRHIEAVGERLRSEMRRVAERIFALAHRLDRLEASVRAEIRRSRNQLGATERLSCAELSRKIQALDARFSELGPR